MEEELKNKWYIITSNLSANANEAKLAIDNLIEKYNEPHRHYHNINHIRNIISDLDAAYHAQIVTTADYNLLAVAMFYHDAIYDVHAKDNEEQSAKLFLKDNEKLKISEDDANKICELIMATKHPHIPQSINEAVMIDCDLAILGASTDEFEEYDKNIRLEYKGFPLADRLKSLRLMLASAPFYKTEFFSNLYEAKAKTNISNKIAEIEKLLR